MNDCVYCVPTNLKGDEFYYLKKCSALWKMGEHFYMKYCKKKRKKTNDFKFSELRIDLIFKDKWA